jgi:ribonuclease HI
LFLKQVYLYTDGACSGNPGPGGWGAILRFGSHQRELSGAQPNTTNNRMELTAVLEGLTALKEPCQVELYSDSTYVVNSVEKGWVYNWQRKNWMKKPGEPVPNADLWKRLLELLKIHKVNFHWVRGHAGHPENERCDQMAVESYKKLIQTQKL